MQTIKLLNYKFLLIVILIFAAILRLWNLGNIPPHLTPDEAALGYNAYSILKTGKDEHGKVLPVVFKSFGDYKPGLYVYATVPFVAVLGLNEWSVRIPSAVSGIMTVYLLFLLTQKLFRGEKTLSLAITFVAALNPWLIFVSRGAWEVNLSLTLTLAGIYFFLLTLEKIKFLPLSVVFFASTLITYQGAKLATGIVLILIAGFYWKEIIKILKQRENQKYIFGSLVLGLVIALPILISLFTEQSGRLQVFSIFSYPRPKEYIQAMLNEENAKIGGINYYLFHGEAYNFLRGIMGRLSNHFSGKFLFFEGDFSNPRHSSPYQGVLLASDVFLLLLGFTKIFQSFTKQKKEKLFILFWLILASCPAILSRDQVHTIRALNLAIPLIFVLGFGLRFLVGIIRKSEYKYALVAFSSFVYALGLIYFLDSYFVHVPKHNSRLWEYGYKQIVETVTPIQGNYKKIVVQQSFAQPYIYFLFYQKYDPDKYQKQNSYIPSEFKGDVGYVTKLGNITFGPIDWSVNRGDRGVLFVSDALRIPAVDSSDPNQFRLIREIKYLDNLNLAFKILEVR